MTTLGIFGLGAFGRLIGQHTASHFELKAYDPSPQAASFALQHKITLTSPEETAKADIVVFATPVESISEAIKAVKGHLKPGTLVMDVGSVKILTTKIMQEELPDHVDIIGTHPLFGPQSAKNGIAGLKIAVCPIRGERAECVINFLRDKLNLQVIVTTPEEHDREMAAAQGLTHLIAKVLVEMEPLPLKMTTVSFDLILRAVEMVRYDSIELFLAIGRDNPYSADVRHRFFAKAEQLQKLLEARTAKS